MPTRTFTRDGYEIRVSDSGAVVRAPDGREYHRDGVGFNEASELVAQIQGGSVDDIEAGLSQLPKGGFGRNFGAGAIEGVSQSVGGLADLAQIGAQVRSGQVLGRSLRGEPMLDASGLGTGDRLQSVLEDATGLGNVEPQPGTADTLANLFGRGVGETLPTAAVPVARAGSLGGIVRRGLTEASASTAGVAAGDALEDGGALAQAAGAGLADFGVSTIATASRPARAARLLDQIPDLDEGAVDGAQSVAAVYARRRELADATNAAWNAAESAIERVGDVSISADPIRNAAAAIVRKQRANPDSIPSFVSNAANWDGDSLEIQDLRVLLSAVSEAQVAAKFDPTRRVEAGIAKEFRVSVEKALDALEAQAPDAIRELRAARRATGELRTYEEFGQTERPRNQVNDTSAAEGRSTFGAVFFDPRRSPESSDLQFQKLFSANPQPGADARRLMNAAKGNALAESSLRRGYIQFVLGDPESGSVGASGALTRLRKTRGAARALFGDRGLAQFERNLRGAAKGRSLTNNNQMTRNLLFATAAGGGGGGLLTGDVGGTAAVAATAAGLEFARQRYGSQAVRRYAIEALADPQKFQLIRRGRPRGGLARRSWDTSMARQMARIGASQSNEEEQ